MNLYIKGKRVTWNCREVPLFTGILVGVKVLCSVGLCGIEQDAMNPGSRAGQKQ